MSLYFLTEMQIDPVELPTSAELQDDLRSAIDNDDIGAALAAIGYAVYRLERSTSTSLAKAQADNGADARVMPITAELRKSIADTLGDGEPHPGAVLSNLMLGFMSTDVAMYKLRSEIFALRSDLREAGLQVRDPES